MVARDQHFQHRVPAVESPRPVSVCPLAARLLWQLTTAVRLLTDVQDPIYSVPARVCLLTLLSRNVTQPEPTFHISPTSSVAVSSCLQLAQYDAFKHLQPRFRTRVRPHSQTATSKRRWRERVDLTGRQKEAAAACGCVGSLIEVIWENCLSSFPTSKKLSL